MKLVTKRFIGLHNSISPMTIKDLAKVSLTYNNPVDIIHLISAFVELLITVQLHEWTNVRNAINPCWICFINTTKVYSLHLGCASSLQYNKECARPRIISIWPYWRTHNSYTHMHTYTLIFFTVVELVLIAVSPSAIVRTGEQVEMSPAEVVQRSWKRGLNVYVP